MKITTEVTDKNDFDFWSGAISTVDALDDAEFEQVMAELEMLYPEGMTDTELNDLFWFDEDFVAQCLGYADWEDFEENKDED